MATTSRSETRPERSSAGVGTSGWVGWVVFAGALMMILGLFHGVQGLVALSYTDYYLVGPNGLTFQMDYSTWGWTHLVAGAVVLIAGVGVLAGQTWARAVGIVMALLSAMLNFVFIAAYPVWSVVVIALDVVIIYALAVHSRELSAR